MGAATNSDVTWGSPTLTLPRKSGRGDTAVPAYRQIVYARAK
jgi:hypothetical protein